MVLTRDLRVRRTARVAFISLVMALVIGMTASLASAGASVDRVGPIVTVVPTAYADNPAGVELMFAECDYVQRVTKPGGSATETQHCQLLGPFVDFPGTVPSEAFTNSEGPCVWFSDYIAETSGGVEWAESVRLTVTPSGNVSVTTTYPATPLDC